MKNTISSKDVVWSYAGIRPLLNDFSENASKVTRDYEFDLDKSKAPILSIFGGKLTTYRKLSEHALEKISEVLSFSSQTWTDKEKLPGSTGVNGEFLRDLEPNIKNRILETYGDQVSTLHDYYKKLSGGGEKISNDLFEFEVAYLVEKEMARTAEDILFRRTKVGIDFPSEKLDLLKSVINRYNKSPLS